MNDDFQPSPQKDYSANQPSTIQWVLIAVLGLVAACGIILFLSGGAFTAYNYFNRQPAPLAEVLVPGATSTVDNHATELQMGRNWPLLLYDTFDDNQNEWIDGAIDDDYATIDVSIDGGYTWNITAAKQGFIWRTWPTVDQLSDFYLAVDAQNRSDNFDAQYGLIFRNLDENYYYFEVRDGQFFRFFLFEANQWKELLPYTYSEAIRPGEINHLDVLSQENQFTLWINDQFVGQANGSYPTQGEVGVIVGISYEGETGLIAFDNFEVRVPALPTESQP